MRTHRLTVLVAALAALALAAPAAAQQGELKVRVTPDEAYLFVDGEAIGEGDRTISLPAGDHEVGVYNYGFKPDVQTVTIRAGETTEHSVTLQSTGGSVSGPWGRIQVEGPGRAAVLLNGKTPDYYVGHVDEFNHDFIWKQELVVPPGSHQLTVTRQGNELWSGTVNVGENEKVVVSVPGGSTSTSDWDRGRTLGTVPRFTAGTASATIAVGATQVGAFSASPGQINCGDSSRLAWQTSEAVDVTLNGNDVAASGEQLVSPKQTTSYTLEAAGPGGRLSEQASVNVNAAIDASLNADPGEVRYRKMGDRVIEHTTATLDWSTSNADEVRVSDLGTVSNSGSRTVRPAPRQQSMGAVDETKTYTLTATNPCGGRQTASANVRITGSIEPTPEVVLHSVFFPTDYPDARNPNLGLLQSQKRGLSLLVEGFRKYMEYDPNAVLRLEAHTDVRRSRDYNQALAERRAAIVKQFLVDQGLPAGIIQTQGIGEDQQLERTTVNSLEEQNPASVPAARRRARYTNWLAHNRRVDIILRPAGQMSQRYYPHDAGDSRILWQAPKPARRVVEENQ